jgi:hypothetical protein
MLKTPCFPLRLNLASAARAAIHGTPYIAGYIFQCAAMPIQIAEEFHRPRRVALRARSTSRRRRDSEEPRVEMAKTRGLRRWAAARRVAVW